MNDEPETTAVAVRSPEPLALIQSAIQQGLDPDKLTKLFELQERHEKAQAAREFAAAVTAFQAECPPVVKERAVKNANGTPRYHFANYEDLMAVAGPILARHDIFVNFDTVPFEGMLMVTCKVRVGIHVEPSAVTVPLMAGGSGSNDVQALGSTVSYGKRYALINALNIVVVDEDDDARSAAPPRQQQPQRQHSPPPPPAGPEKEVTLDTLVRACGRPTPPDNGSLVERWGWLTEHLKRLAPDFDPADFNEALCNRLGEDWQPPTLTAAQRQLAWVATVEYVTGVAKQKAGVS